VFELYYLPSFKRDLAAIAGYITKKLQAPKAALDLIDSVEAAVLQLRDSPFAHRLYQPLIPIDAEYRILPVKNYLVFYIVLEDKNTVELHRIIYKRRDLPQLVH
jgi:addiction module RelE/StbE family toxin